MSDTGNENPTGPFVVWVDYGYDGWSHESYATLREALEADKYSSDFVITKIVDYVVTEVEPAA